MMLFREYETSCKRHMRACDSLLKNLSEYPVDKQAHLLQEVYYLAGYIFECIYKYAIFARISYPDQDPIENLKEVDLTFKKLKTHDFKKLKDLLDQRMPGNIPFIKFIDGIEDEVIKLYNDWTPQFRYKENLLVSEETIVKFLSWAKKTRTEILNNI